MNKYLFTIVLFTVTAGFAIAQNEDGASSLNQIIVPTQIITAPTDGDTTGSLVNAEGQEANIAYNEAVTQFNAGNYEMAIVLYDQALMLNPSLHQSYYGRASCYIKQNKHNQAIGDLQTYAKHTNDNNATFLIGYCYFAMKEEENALSSFQNAVEQGCSNADIFYYMGVLHFNKKEYDQAIMYFTRSIDINDKYAFAYHDRGSTYRMQEKYDKALADYEKATQLNDKMDIFFANLGSAYRLNKDYKNALQAYDKALKINPKSHIVLNNKGIAYLENKEYDRAIETFEECIQLKRDYAYAYCNLGICYYRKNDFDKAIEYYSRAINYNDKYAEAYLYRGSAKEVNRDLNGACSDWQEAKRLGASNLENIESICSDYQSGN